VSEQLALLPGYLTAHLQLTLLALLLSTAISLPLGVAVSRTPWLEGPALGIAGVIQTIPSLALLAVMVPLLAYFDLQSIGFLPAIVGLTLYGVLPILRNTVTGIAGVDPALKEAARGVGMTSRQQLVWVELPLAMPVIVAGMRTATVWVVGIATLSTPVGAPSLGNYLFSGLQTRNYTAVLVGCVAAAGLALVLDHLVRAVEDGIRTRRRARVAAALTVLAALFAYAMVALAAPLWGDRDRPIRIGSKTFTEQYVLSALLARWIQDETGHVTALTQSLGSLVAFDALVAGDIDVYVDYSGTLWANEMGRDTVSVDRADLLRDVEVFLRDTHGIRLAAVLGFENAYALAMRRTHAEMLGIRLISDLARHARTLRMGSDYEFFARPEWAALRTAYGLDFAELRSMDSALMYQAAARSNVDVISAFSTDGRIAAFDLRVLDDDRNAIPPYDAVILVSRRLVAERPEVLDALARLAGTIDAETMRRMNLAVDEKGQGPTAVAAAFVETLRADDGGLTR
jgi:osmoprotectant transport system permease protein